MSEIRVPATVSEPVSEGAPKLRVPAVVSEPVAEGAPKLRVPLSISEPVAEGHPLLRVPLLILEAVISIPEEGELATDVLPVLRGLSWSVHKRPNFNVQVRRATNNRKVTNSLTPFPYWEFEQTYDYLPNKTAGATDLKTLAGFWLAMGGRFKAWLFQDPTDYLVTGDAQIRFTDYQPGGDGVTTEFYLTRAWGAFNEPVGQLNTATIFTFAPGAVNTGADTITHAAHGLATADGPLWVSSTATLPGGLVAATPYWAIRVDANTIKLAASKANALAGTAIDLTSQGTGTHSLTWGLAVYVGGTLQTSGVTWNTPNKFTFAVAPTNGAVITADFRFYFVCRFSEDVIDLENFADTFWSLQKFAFESDVP